jgi:hypothetical protein
VFGEGEERRKRKEERGKSREEGRSLGIVSEEQRRNNSYALGRGRVRGKW